jgi:DNA-binding transcriptional LysR family regulator
LRVNTVQAGIDAAMAGLGIIRTLSYQVKEPLAANRLRPVLVDPGTPALPVSLLYQSHRKETPAIRAFTQMVIAAFRQSSF